MPGDGTWRRAHLLVVIASAALVFAGQLFAASKKTATSTRTPESLTDQASWPATRAPRREPPQEASTAAAFAVFKARCAGCHHREDANDPPPAGGLGHILDLEALAVDPAFIRPGLPDGSRVFDYLLAQQHGAAAALPPIMPIEVMAIYDWIAGLSPAETRCADRPLVSDADLDTAMLAWLDSVGAEAARSTRFISLVPQYNACASETRLSEAAAAVRHVLNSVSSAPRLATLHGVGSAGWLYAFRLEDIAWTETTWATIVGSDPLAHRRVAVAVAQKTGVDRPLLRGDWLAARALRAPLYYEILNVPGSFAALKQLLDMPDDDSRMTTIERPRSWVTNGPRRIGRWESRAGSVWLAEDEAGGKVAGLRVRYSLSNGLPAFAVYGPDGRRWERVDVDLDRPVASRVGPTRAGSACLACHWRGLRTSITDPGAAHSAANDNYRLELTLADIPGDLNNLWHGLDQVSALARGYEKPIDLAQTAAEAGIDQATLSARVAAVQSDERGAGMRLMQSAVTRVEANALLAVLRANDAPNLSIGTPSHGEEPARGTINLWSDKPAYRRGDAPTIFAETDRDCSLTVISVDVKGRATVIFPNEYEPDGNVARGLIVAVPRPGSPYRLKFSDRGTERFIALCDEALPKPVAPRFGTQKFLMLGDWRRYLETGLPPAFAEVRPLPTLLRRRGRNRPPNVLGPQATGAIARTAIELSVRD